MRRLKLDLHSIQAKLNIVLIVLVTIILAGFGIYDYLVMKKRTIGELHSIAESSARRLSGGMAVAIWEMHRDTGIASLESEMVQKSVYAIVVEETGHEAPFVAMKRDEDTWEPVSFSGNIEGDFIASSKEVVKGEEELGSVHVFLTQQFMEEDLRGSLFSLLFKILLLDLILVVGMSLVFRKVVTRPLNQIVDRVRDIAEGEGDLTMRIDFNSLDEIGTLAGLFNGFIGNLEGVIRQLSENIKRLDFSSTQLANVSTQMASSAEEMTSQCDSVAGATDEMSSNINAIASAAEEMSTNIQSVSSTTEEMSQNVNTVASSIEEMSTALNDVATGARKGSDIAKKAMQMSTSALDTMNLLGRGAKDIGEVTELIKRIAEQTNLLALNATIEAASAGAAGKGFAVVANEIKELANQSAQAAEDIAKRIEGTQANSEEAIKVIAAISDVIESVNESSAMITESVEQQKVTASGISGNIHEASTGITNIASSIAEIGKGANDMARGAAEGANAMTEVSSNIQGVSKAAAESNTGARQVNTSAGELANMAVEIQGMVGRFKVKEA